MTDARIFLNCESWHHYLALENQSGILTELVDAIDSETAEAVSL